MDWSANALRRNAQPPSQSSWSSSTRFAVRRAVIEFWRAGVFRLQTEVVLMLASSFVNITELIDRCPLGPLQISIIALCGLVTLLDFADRICAHCQNAPV